MQKLCEDFFGNFIELYFADSAIPLGVALAFFSGRLFGNVRPQKKFAKGILLDVAEEIFKNIAEGIVKGTAAATSKRITK